MFLFILKYIFFFTSLFKQGLDWIFMGILSMPSYDRPGERLKKLLKNILQNKYYTYKIFKYYCRLLKHYVTKCYCKN